MAEIIIKGLTVLIDDDDLPYIQKINWQKNGTNGHVYFQYAKRTGPLTTYVSLHRLLAGATKGTLVDHINHDTLDNRKSNLRLCTHSGNSQNSRVRTETKGSIYKGVYRQKKTQKWAAHIGFNKQQTDIGVYDSEIEAAKVYDSVAAHLFGEFACPNFPNPIPHSIEYFRNIKREQKGAFPFGKNKWFVRVYFNQKGYYIGSFDNKVAALEQRRKALQSISNNTFLTDLPSLRANVGPYKRDIDFDDSRPQSRNLISVG